MDVALQRHCAKYIYVIPEGLRELMSDISREVLRSQSEQIYTFIADYLDALLITRENARVAARFVESLTEVATTITELLVRTGMSREEADRVATIIQVAFRKHLTEKEALREKLCSEAVEEANIITEILYEAQILPEQAEQAAVIIQHAWRQFKQRQEAQRDLLKGIVDWRVAARSTMRLYRKTGVTNEEANRAATLIKAAYKGYYTRRIMRRLLEEARLVEEEEEEEEGEEEEEPEGEEQGSEESDKIFGLDKLAISQTWEQGEPEATQIEIMPQLSPAEKTSSQEIVTYLMGDIIKQVIPSSMSITDTSVTTPTSAQTNLTTPTALPLETADEVSLKELAESEDSPFTKSNEGMIEETTQLTSVEEDIETHVIQEQREVIEASEAQPEAQEVIDIQADVEIEIVAEPPDNTEPVNTDMEENNPEG